MGERKTPGFHRCKKIENVVCITIIAYNKFVRGGRRVQDTDIADAGGEGMQVNVRLQN